MRKSPECVGAEAHIGESKAGEAVANTGGLRKAQLRPLVTACAAPKAEVPGLAEGRSCAAR